MAGIGSASYWGDKYSKNNDPTYSPSDTSKSKNYIILMYGSTYKAVYLPTYPDEISDQGSANYTEDSLLGRSSPLVSYNSTNMREVSFSFDVHREIGSQVENLLRVARASVYPSYGGTVANTNVGDNNTSSAVAHSTMRPSLLIVRMADFYAKGIVRSYAITWKKPIINGKYMVCSVSITMADMPNEVISAGTILSRNPGNPLHNGFSQT